MPAMRQLKKTDPVYRCVDEMKRLLRPLAGSSLFGNGKVEMQLKMFIGEAWERGHLNSRAYIMDKPFYLPRRRNTPTRTPDAAKKKRRTLGGLDFVALEDSHKLSDIPRAAFWIETKCSFSQDYTDARKSAKSALKQTETTLHRLVPWLTTCDAYIVHFINHIPDAKSLLRRAPDIARKFKTLAKSSRSIAPKTLLSIYRRHNKGRQYAASAVIRISQKPVVDAIVVKLKLSTEARRK